MTAGPKPAPPTFSVGDRVTEIHRDGRMYRVATVAKVLASGARIRTENGDEYTRSKGRGAVPIYAWNGYYSGFARAWQDGDEKAIALAGMKTKRDECDQRARSAVINADAEHRRASEATTEAKGHEMRASEYAAERDRIDVEIAALEGGGS